jgi:hypothetical protein
MLTLNRPKKFTIKPANPIPTLVYIGMIQQFLQQYGHSNLDDSLYAKKFRQIVIHDLIPSPLSTGTLADQATLYTQYVDDIFKSYVGYYHDYSLPFEITIKVASRLYDPRNPNYTGLGLD